MCPSPLTTDNALRWPEDGVGDGGLLSHNTTHHVCRLFLGGVGVLHHSILADEAFAADVAREWLFADMQAHVSARVSLMVELFGTHLTLVGVFPSMLYQVLLKIQTIN